jgi:hypothetical protein
MGVSRNENAAARYFRDTDVTGKMLQPFYER